jgi:hypothetical protein
MLLISHALLILARHRQHAKQDRLDRHDKLHLGLREPAQFRYVAWQRWHGYLQVRSVRQKNRRIYKSSSSGTSIFAYDGDNLVEETNSSGAVVARYSQGLNVDERLAMVRSGATSYILKDKRLQVREAERAPTEKVGGQP